MKKIVVPFFGMISGLVIVIWSIMSSGLLSAFLDGPSFVIIFFGSMSAVLISIPFDKIKGIPRVMKELLIDREDSRVEIVQLFIEFSKKTRMNGVLSIEGDVQRLENEAMHRGLQMVVDGKEGEIVTSQMELEMERAEDRDDSAAGLFGNWSEFAPAFGMIGTLIGLIMMLGELDDPSLIESGIVTALITTFYGIMLANLDFLPFPSSMKLLIAEKMVT